MSACTSATAGRPQIWTATPSAQRNSSSMTIGKRPLPSIAAARAPVAANASRVSAAASTARPLPQPPTEPMWTTTFTRIEYRVTPKNTLEATTTTTQHSMPLAQIEAEVAADKAQKAQERRERYSLILRHYQGILDKQGSLTASQTRAITPIDVAFAKCFTVDPKIGKFDVRAVAALITYLCKDAKLVSNSQGQLAIGDHNAAAALMTAAQFCVFTEIDLRPLGEHIDCLQSLANVIDETAVHTLRFGCKMPRTTAQAFARSIIKRETSGKALHLELSTVLQNQWVADDLLRQSIELKIEARNTGGKTHNFLWLRIANLATHYYNEALRIGPDDPKNSDVPKMLEHARKVATLPL